MINFTKLRTPTAEEPKADDERRLAQAIADDNARRRERSRKSVTITLNRETECRFTMSGTQVAHLYGLQSNGKPVRAIWYAPDHLDRDAFDASTTNLTEGTELILKGYWKPFKGTSGTTFTFVAQFFEASPSH